jgi:hypothetical protein
MDNCEKNEMHIIYRLYISSFIQFQLRMHHTKFVTEDAITTRAGTWAVPFEGGSWQRSFSTTRSTARHEIFWTVLARHEHEGRAVPRISTRPATWPGPHLGPARHKNDT